ncbi:hypothetical protein BN439_0383 [Erwinia amylovora Ea644]|nr:hypothetical protein BN439_0383 [Erwinia amylovora Ea644]CCP05470.1 hypothetical protein BN440_0417 [Erwinia amylovora MR1]
MAAGAFSVLISRDIFSPEGVWDDPLPARSWHGVVNVTSMMLAGAGHSHPARRWHELQTAAINRLPSPPGA